MNKGVYILGGAQSDFARDMYSEGKTVFDLFSETLEEALGATCIDPSEVERGHIANASGDVLTRYAQMGGFFGMADSGFAGMPASRHEAACCSGSMAILGAIADICAGFYRLICVAGVEVMAVDSSNISEFATVDQAIGAHAWPTERREGEWVWPALFSHFQRDYQRRYGLDYKHLGEISRINLKNARRNPNARARNYQSSSACFMENDDVNPVTMSDFRVHDVCRTADGAAVVFLADEQYSREFARTRGLKLEHIPRIKSFAHSTMPTELSTKQRLIEASGNSAYMPHLKGVIEAAVARAGLRDVRSVDALEVHDCFSISEYMILDHCGITEPGQVWKLIEDGSIEPSGDLPVNPSGGLIGAGHPIGCTGVRMALDCSRQVAGDAGDYQVEGASNVMMVNVGGTLTTVAALVTGL